jgi:hypothetical protein
VRGEELRGVGVSWMLSEKQPTQEKSRSNPNGTVLGKRATEMPTSCGPLSKVSSYVPAFAPHHIEAANQTCVPLTRLRTPQRCPPPCPLLEKPPGPYCRDLTDPLPTCIRLEKPTLKKSINLLLLSLPSRATTGWEVAGRCTRAPRRARAPLSPPQATRSPTPMC